MIKKILLSLLILAALLLIFNSSYAGQGFRIVNQQSVYHPIVYGFPWEDPQQSANGTAQLKGTEPWVTAPAHTTNDIDIWTKTKFFFITRGYLLSNWIYFWFIDEESTKDMVMIR
ncbi:exported hypothetical protein [Candidatus Zixiibacteriota bacterium]|nr:exported hypothetical protein [candidate division Zixibacteria bacterium]